MRSLRCWPPDRPGIRDQSRPLHGLDKLTHIYFCTPSKGSGREKCLRFHTFASSTNFERDHAEEPKAESRKFEAVCLSRLSCCLMLIDVDKC